MEAVVFTLAISMRILALSLFGFLVARGAGRPVDQRAGPAAGVGGFSPDPSRSGQVYFGADAVASGGVDDEPGRHHVLDA
ncbi:hypothetical protein, partial [Streptomyces sp. NPDC058424]|uniref:hypothetical protein n=1 Tax=Streptomyces sp. NPDC058424 TaxID=3346491 RepID=UPI003667DCDC